MAKREVEFKGKMFALVGPELKPGDKAPDFSCVNSSLEIVNLAQTPAKARLFSVVPSLDTPVCSEQTKRFDEFLAGLKDKAVCYTISLDLPFAQKRFCTEKNVNNVTTLSDTRDHSFTKGYGCLIEGLVMPLASRAIFVVDRNNKITYCEYVPSVPQHPNYEKAQAALKAAVSA
jgi:thiol peroxidase